MPKKLTNKARIELRAATIRSVMPGKCCYNCDFFWRHPFDTKVTHGECSLPIRGDVISTIETSPFNVCDAHTQE